MNTFLCDPLCDARDYATADRLDRLWVIEHRWLALGYRLVGLSILTAAGIGFIALGVKLVQWALAR
jgi:hypothetical protein